MTTILWDEWSGQLQSLGDSEAAEQLRRLSGASRLQQQHWLFCGHFSAGKSTLLNRMTGIRKLPASPVPTSANAVSLTKGDPSVRGLTPEGIWETVPSGQLDESCRDGNRFIELSITDPELNWPGQIVLWDTPGMDSTDEAHERITRRYAPLADLIVYVCDYQHVLAEMNRSFLMQMNQLQRPFVLLVNQMDKHDEAEISFEAYRQQIDTALESWQVRPVAMFFISGRGAKLAADEWPLMMAWFEALANEGENGSWLNLSQKRMAAAILEQSRDRLERQFAEQTEQSWQVAVQRFHAGSNGELSERFSRVQAEEKRRNDEWSRFLELTGQPLKKHWERILEDARIMTAECREQLIQAMETGKTGYKTGWFSTAAKVQAERKKRGLLFAERWRSELQVHLMGPFSDWAGRFEKDIVVRMPEWPAGNAVDQLLQQLEAELDRYCQWEGGLEKLFPLEQSFTDAYHLTLANQLTEQVRLLFRRCLNDWYAAHQQSWTTYAGGLRLRNEQEGSDDRQLSAWMTEQQNTEAEQQKTLLELKSFAKSLRDSGSAMPWDHLSAAQADVLAAIRSRHRLRSTDHLSGTGRLSPARYPDDISLVQDTGFYSHKGSGVTAANQLNKYKQWVENYVEWSARWPSLLEYRQRLVSRLDAVNSNELTLSVFGAFSAGKSTLINAMLGNDSLPVSPHPTTAALVTLRKRPEGSLEDTIRIQWKSRADMEQQIGESAHLIGMDRNQTPERIFEQMNREKRHLLPPHLEARRSFLLAASKGWTEWSVYLGQTVEWPLSRLAETAASESCSCFVAGIEVRMDHPLTASGMVLADTPGADSVFARHTELAYRMAKQADGIIYLCTYQHAFTQSDRRFLTYLAQTIQVGQQLRSQHVPVYFLLNAVDLAESKAEIQLVEDHLREALRACGFADPWIFPLSARRQVKTRTDDGFAVWQQHLFKHVHEQRHERLQKALQQEMLSSVHAFEHQIDRENMRLADREGAKARWFDHASRWEIQLSRLSDERREKGLEREASELLYYMKQRLQFRMGDWFRECFSPAVFRPENPSGPAFLMAMRDWNDTVRKSWDDELVITQIRLEKVFRQALQERLQEERMMLNASGGAGPEACAVREAWLQMPRFSVPALDLSLPDHLGKEHIKNLKSFFEGGGRERLMKMIDAESGPLWEEATDRLITSWCQQLRDAFRSCLTQAAAEWLAERDGQASAWEHAEHSTEDIAKWTEQARTLESGIPTFFSEIAHRMN